MYSRYQETRRRHTRRKLAASGALIGVRIYFAEEVAEFMGGWSTQRARRWLLNTGAGVKCGGRVQTTLPMLMEHWPTAYSIVEYAIRMREDEFEAA